MPREPRTHSLPSHETPHDTGVAFNQGLRRHGGVSTSARCSFLQSRLACKRGPRGPRGREKGQGDRRVQETTGQWPEPAGTGAAEPAPPTGLPAGRERWGIVVPRSNAPHRASDTGECTNPPSSGARSRPTGPTREMGILRLSGFSGGVPQTRAWPGRQVPAAPRL